MRIFFEASHAYAGCRAAITGASGDPGAAMAGTGIAEFADGAASFIAWTFVADGDLVTTVGAYRTTRGTDIAAKTWRLRRIDGGTRWKVVGKAPAASSAPGASDLPPGTTAGHARDAGKD